MKEIAKLEGIDWIIIVALVCYAAYRIAELFAK